MKNFLLFLSIFILGIFLFVSVRSCNEHKRNSIASQNALLIQAQYGGITPLEPINTRTDTVYRTLVSTYKPTITPQEVASSGGISPAYIDSVSRALNIAQDKITSLTKANVNLSAKLKLFQEVDTVTGRLWAIYKDKTFDIKYYPDSNEMDIRANVGINILDHKSRKSFLHPWNHYTEVWTTDERFTINGMHRVIKEAPKGSRWGVDAFAGPSFTRDGMNIAFGVGIGYRLIEF